MREIKDEKEGKMDACLPFTQDVFTVLKREEINPEVT